MGDETPAQITTTQDHTNINEVYENLDLSDHFCLWCRVVGKGREERWLGKCAICMGAEQWGMDGVSLWNWRVSIAGMSQERSVS